MNKEDRDGEQPDQLWNAVFKTAVRNVTRFEVIEVDSAGRVYVAGYDVYKGGPGVSVELSLQEGAACAGQFRSIQDQT
jgi:hypothetical protein